MQVVIPGHISIVLVIQGRVEDLTTDHIIQVVIYAAVITGVLTTVARYNQVTTIVHIMEEAIIQIIVGLGLTEVITTKVTNVVHTMEEVTTKIQKTNTNVVLITGVATIHTKVRLVL